jgi:Dolichyl-phosphate-mannose-protein mannosyltransferase
VRKIHAVVFTLIAISFQLLVNEQMADNFVTLDEYAHVPAGVSHWELGTFFLYRENPPLIRSLIALPVWLSRPETVYASARSNVGQRSEGKVAADFLDANAGRYDQLIWRARSVTLVLSLACGALIFLWSSQLFGGWVGVACSALWFLDPSVIAHSGLATLDVGASLAGLLATYGFWRFLRAPSWRGAGVLLGMAQASKFSMLSLYPSWLILLVVTRHPRGREDAGKPAPRSRWAQAAVIVLISLVTLNAAYAFEGTFTSLGGYSFRSSLFQGPGAPEGGVGGNRLRDSILTGLPVPLPIDYVQGFDSQKYDEEIGLARREDGRLVRRGHAYSPVVTLAYKLPLGTLAILAATGAYLVCRRRGPGRDELVLIIPAALFLVLLGTQTGLNWAFRYSLPLLPFLFIAAGAGIRGASATRVGKLLVILCLAWNATAVLRARPSFLSYGNEIVGGAAGARREFLGSNLDWGQDLHRLKALCNAHPEVKPLALTYYGVMDPQRAGLTLRALPAAFLAGRTTQADERAGEDSASFYWAISANVLNGLPGPIVVGDDPPTNAVIRSEKLDWNRAAFNVGNSIFVFKIDAVGSNAGAEPSIRFEDLRGCIVPIDKQRLVSP